MLISVIADYGDLHDLAFAEVTQKLYYELGDLQASIKAYAVPAFDTVATGFSLAQTAINSKLGNGHKFYVNTAPRKDDLTPRVGDKAVIVFHESLDGKCVVGQYANVVEYFSQFGRMSAA